jgi:propionyl-CoA carboxylase alpha chain
MGVRPVAIYSDADRDAPHARATDEAVAIGASYLDTRRIIDAARAVNADAIHPGYGFLAENADFAEACPRAGLVFIGPSPEAIRKMGRKIAAREIAAATGVPVVPSFDSAAPMEFPVLIKASAGGGGRGMRIVTQPDQLAEALQSAGREAERAFGDGSLLIERYIQRARHIEFQIFGDQHGKLIHLFERECSIQRRHQKIIEESPSPALTDALRDRMGQAAIAIGRAIGYTNAGTVEFLLAPTGEFYFIEVNTRIQVEHPVTELVTGLDLVRLQIEVAEGKPLPDPPALSGHAIEARLNAEDPVNDFLPSTGTVHRWRPPSHVRVDTAIEAGVEIGIHYDSLLAKIISYGPDRDAALRKLSYALRSTCLAGVRTNREYLIQILETPEFREGRAHTAFLPAPEQAAEPPDQIAAAALFLDRSPVKGIPPNFRNNPYRDPSRKFRIGDRNVEVSWKQTGRQAYSVAVGEAALTVSVVRREHDRIALSIDGITRTYEVVQSGDALFVQSSNGSTTLTQLSRHPRSSTAGQRETANAPMPGQVLRILVRQGQQVKMGDSLVVLEAMKMEQTIRTTINGVIQSVLVKAGQVVAPGQMLVQIGAEETP